MTRIQVNIPDGVIGDWCVKSITGDSTTIFTDLYGNPSSSEWEEPYGKYTFLMHSPHQGLIMMDTTTQYILHEPLWLGATGSVLIGGLGLGFVNQKLLDNPYVTSVTIVEKYQEVIDLVWPYCPKDSRFTLVHTDMETWNPPEGSYWNYAWIDTWTPDNPMTTSEYASHMSNKFAPYCDEIGVWCVNQPS